MSQNYQSLLSDLAPYIKQLHNNSPEVMPAFSKLSSGAIKDGTINRKTKELIALALGVIQRCEPCIAHHAKAAVELGATKEEVVEMLEIVILMGGGPALMYAAKALQAYETFTS